MTLIFSRPAALHGQALEQELRAAGFAHPRVSESPEGLMVEAYHPGGEPLGEADRASVETVVSAHGGQPPLPDRDRLNLQSAVRSDLASLRTKARSVYGGADTFTESQMQRLVAALTLRG